MNVVAVSDCQCQSNTNTRWDLKLANTWAFMFVDAVPCSGWYRTAWNELFSDSSNFIHFHFRGPLFLHFSVCLCVNFGMMAAIFCRIFKLSCNIVHCKNSNSHQCVSFVCVCMYEGGRTVYAHFYLHKCTSPLLTQSNPYFWWLASFLTYFNMNFSMIYSTVLF